MGVWITYKGRETPFWYACNQRQRQEVVRSHFQTWIRDENGPILMSDATALYVTKWGKDESGQDRIEESEVLDVPALVR